MSELKPCPFCGRIPVLEDCGNNRFFVRCNCGIVQNKLYWQKCDAVRHWNTRKELKVIADALSEKFAYMNTCLNERDIILGYLGVKRPSKTHCNTDCTNIKCESYRYNKGYHPRTQSEQRWIPCSESLPGECEDIIITYIDDEETRIIPVNYGKGTWYDCIFNTALNPIKVIAWMPLPEPYQEGEQNE